MTVTEIVKAYLQEHGYDGLVSSDGECGCNLADLIPDAACGEDDCEPGYTMPCTCAEGHDYHITTDRAKALAARAEKPSVPMKECPKCRGDGKRWTGNMTWEEAIAHGARTMHDLVTCKRCDGTGKVVA